MSHNHAHDHAPNGDLRIAFLLNLSFTLLEIVGGLLINSVAILSDALHDFGDSLSLALAWYLQRVSEQGSDGRYSYGYRRFSLLAALINAIVLVGGSLFILTEAVPRLLDPESFNAPGMIAFAVVGVAINGFAAYRLRGSKTANVQVVSWHLLEDVLGWVAVLIVGIVSLFVDLPILDPILSILITLYVLVNVLNRLRQSVRLFLQAVPENIDLPAIEQSLRDIEGVRSIHHTHIWSLDGERHVFTAHLVVDDAATSDAVIRIRQAGQRVVENLNLEHVTIAVEYEREACEMRQQHPEQHG
ncbi:MAG: cation transporter [Anaerolineaceae bacterium]|nr:cation transporter [Anaerolineaceae bacterium]